MLCVSRGKTAGLLLASQAKTLNFFFYIRRLKHESDLRGNEHYLSSSKNKARKRFRPVQDLNP